ncbi:beta-1,3-galactosyltransferase pvg3-like [Nicotiana tomentosiformis]|uniref:beta-1,3-galactosyltransferase pvg3-like n=1 Tax=Nicotiana tomentosiformis TaxID=4098 RepID=UPI00051AD054|nr:hydroxyproline O-galactosyltransferase GALT2-like [Nicotiana tomentosiformis]
MITSFHIEMLPFNLHILILSKLRSLAFFPSQIFALHVTMKTYKPNGRRFIISSFFFIIFLCVLASINEIRFDSFLILGSCAFSQTPTRNSSSATNFLSVNSSSLSTNNEIRILIGILTLPDQYQKRHFLRLIYGTQPPIMGAKVDIKFVFCNLTKEDQKVLVALEIMRYDDIIILNCQENMNKGKTYTYFSSLPELFSVSDDQPYYPPYHYVMKADDDTYIRLESFVESLRPLPREDLYYGYVIPCPSMDPFVHYMSGMGYLVSWDIAEWIRDSDIPKSHLEGPEDKVFGEWLRDGHRARHRYNAKWSMYNFPEPPTRCTHELWPDTIAVHMLKNQEKWIQTLNYFNVTRDLKPSKLYHI